MSDTRVMPSPSMVGLAVHAAQAAPNSLPRSIIGAQGALSSTEQAELQAFVAAWTEQLAEGDSPRSLEDARRILTDPLRDPSASQAFLSFFSTVAIPKLTPIVEGPDLRRAVHAMQVIRFIRTPDAVSVLASQVSKNRAPLAEKRLAAAGLLGMALSDANLNQPQFDSTIRQIESAASTEKNELVIVRLVDALGGVATRQTVGKIAASPAASATLARSVQINILRSMANGLANSKTPVETVNAIQEIVVRLRSQWLNSGLKGPELQKLGVALAPALVDALSAIQSQWDASRKDPALEAACRSAIGFVEPLLGLADSAARGSTGGGTGKAFSTAWSGGDSDAFGKELTTWKATVSKAPYR